MPHTTRSCNDPYASGINQIFVENRVPLVDLSEPDPGGCGDSNGLAGVTGVDVVWRAAYYC